MFPQPARAIASDEPSWSPLTDLLLMGVGLAAFAAMLTIGREWLGPFTPEADISLAPARLPLYAAYSLLRLAVAYVFSLGFALAYGYVAAYNRRAEKVLIPLLDILQSIPVLSFLPGVMLTMIALFPGSQIG